MIITCPNCSGSFNVPDNAIGAEGRKVRCSDCSNEWLATNPLLEPAIKKDESVQNSVNQDTTKKVEEEKVPAEEVKPKVRPGVPYRYVPPKTPFYEMPSLVFLNKLFLMAALLLFIAVLLITHRDEIYEKALFLRPVLNEIGYYPERGLKLEVVDCVIGEIESSKADADTIELEVRVKVRNAAADNVVLSKIRFSIFDANYNFLGKYEMHMSKELKPIQTEEVEGRLNRIPKETMFVAIDIGSIVDMYVNDPTYIHKL